jgi:hypothetical protein
VDNCCLGLRINQIFRFNAGFSGDSKGVRDQISPRFSRGEEQVSAHLISQAKYARSLARGREVPGLLWLSKGGRRKDGICSLET